MSQNSESFSYSGIFNEDVGKEIFANVSSQELNVLLNGNTFLPITNDPFVDPLYQKETSISSNEEDTVDFKDLALNADQAPIFTQAISSTEIMSNNEYNGHYNFDVCIVPNENTKIWVYSSVLGKVFMELNKEFPVDFKIQNRPHEDLFIRTTLQYTNQQYARDIVRRCIQHNHPKDNTNQDMENHMRHHVLRCSNKQSKYIGNLDQNERLSVIFVLPLPQVGAECVRELFNFGCLTSCATPGMNRREIEVIFTLENARAVVLGRKSFRVRVCACPKRDKDKEEQEMEKLKNGAPQAKKRKTNSTKVIQQSQHHSDLTTYSLNMKFVGKQNILKIMSFAEDLHMAQLFKLEGQAEHSEEYNKLKQCLAEVQAVKKKIEA